MNWIYRRAIKYVINFYTTFTWTGEKRERERIISSRSANTHQEPIRIIIIDPRDDHHGGQPTLAVGPPGTACRRQPSLSCCHVEIRKQARSTLHVGSAPQQSCQMNPEKHYIQILARVAVCVRGQQAPPKLHARCLAVPLSSPLRKTSSPCHAGFRIKSNKSIAPKFH